MNAKIKTIRQQVAELNSVGGRVRYPDKIKNSVIGLLGSGMRPSEISRKTGLNAPTIVKWSQRYEGSKKFRALPVEAAPAVVVSELKQFTVVVDNLRIECESVARLREVLEMLR